MKFKIEYSAYLDGVWRLFIRKRFLFIPYWKSISSSKDIDYILGVKQKLIDLNK